MNLGVGWGATAPKRFPDLYPFASKSVSPWEKSRIGSDRAYDEIKN
ncbi:MAG: hypothetical protein V7K88_10950 [Nostoc sp.]